MEHIEDSTKEVPAFSRQLTGAMRSVDVPVELADLDERLRSGKFAMASYLVWLRREMELHVLLHEAMVNSDDDRIHRVWAHDLGPMMRLENDFKYFGLSLECRLHRPLLPELVDGLRSDSTYTMGVLYALESRHRDINRYVRELKERFRVPNEALTYPVGNGERTPERFARFKRRLNSEAFTEREVGLAKSGARDVAADHVGFMASVFRSRDGS